MKTRPILFLLLMLVITACAPTTTATETDIPSQQQSATQPSIATATTAAEIPTEGPSLEVGMVYPYIDGGNLVAVPGGDFTMGGNGTDNPEHQVSLRDYWIYSTKVTNQQYAWCISQAQCTLPDLNDNPGYTDINRANDPVTGVTYEQATTYCEFVHGRLPTEAEWEKAARDPQGGNYPWGEAEPTCDVLNFNNCANGTSSVVNFVNGASYYGALDMLGNAFEWVSDWYAANYYQNSPGENPSGPQNGSSRVVRSSGYDSNPEDISVSNRNSEDPQTHRSNLGFRCVIDEPAYLAPYCESPFLYGAEGVTSTCPTLDLVQVELCAKNFPYTNVTVTGAADAKLDTQGCIPTDDPVTVSCQPPSTVSAQAGCQVITSGESTCPAGYSLQNGACVADGVQGACPAGSNYDDSKQCCTATIGSDTSLKLAVCPVGTYYAAGQNACLPSPVQELVTVSAEVGFKSCAASGGGGGNCQPPEFGCFSSDWSPTLCCCSPDGFSCF